MQNRRPLSNLKIPGVLLSNYQEEQMQLRGGYGESLLAWQRGGFEDHILSVNPKCCLVLHFFFPEQMTHKTRNRLLSSSHVWQADIWTQPPKTSLLQVLEGVEHMIIVHGSKRDKAELQGEGQKERILPRLLVFTKLLGSVRQGTTQNQLYSFTHIYYLQQFFSWNQEKAIQNVGVKRTRGGRGEGKQNIT